MTAALAQAGLVVLAGLNLNAGFMKAPVGSFGSVRWRELAALGLIVPLSMALLFHVFWILEAGRRDAQRPLISLGVFTALLGISMGVHEPINALGGAPARLAPSLWFWDEIFSHAVFFLAVAGLALTFLWIQVRNPLADALNGLETLAFSGIAAAAGAGIYLTLVPGGSIAWDLSILALLLAVAEGVRRGRPFRRLPLAIVIEGPFLLALAGLLAQRGLAGRW